ncbi:YeeE/YedE family protein [Paraglaciecola aquimarina]|uniref:YeeE/YedE family protein n=1 Tax=Paraglaciecola aquimarina TaxID=1235557 RepID=A0ABU3SWY8_9ALTE|nr:YeeE/YedE family protein [Paraglaciecola aquimarina]MDU0354432.1 YeeE/YedE family protein [Paraglaciecola aquimarina]
MKLIVSAMLAGLVFGSGLTVSGMVDPIRVLNFLDILGTWDPTLVFVIGGGLSVYLPVYYFMVKPKGKTIFGADCQLPTNSKIDKQLLIGSGLFGLGWGLSGICPGPAMTNLSAAQPELIAFVVSMLLGMFIANKLVGR